MWLEPKKEIANKLTELLEVNSETAFILTKVTEEKVSSMKLKIRNFSYYFHVKRNVIHFELHSNKTKHKPTQ